MAAACSPGKGGGGGAAAASARGRTPRAGGGALGELDLNSTMTAL